MNSSNRLESASLQTSCWTCSRARSQPACFSERRARCSFRDATPRALRVLCRFLTGFSAGASTDTSEIEPVSADSTLRWLTFVGWRSDKAQFERCENLAHGGKRARLPEQFHRHRKRHSTQLTTAARRHSVAVVIRRWKA